MDEVDREVWHLIWLDGGMHGHAKLTASTEDGRVHREDGGGAWDPLPSAGLLACGTWYRVSPEIAAEWVADDEDLENELRALRNVADAARSLVTRIAEVGRPSRTDPTVIRLGEAVGALR